MFSRTRIADLLEAFRYDRGNLILANSLHQLIRGNTAPAFQEWTVGIVSGGGPQARLARGLTVPTTPSRSVRLSTDGAASTFRVSGSSARLAGSTDLAKTYAHDGDDLKEPAVYSQLPNPTLLIYPLRPLFEVRPTQKNGLSQQQADDETALACAAWAEATSSGATVLMALKIAIPGVPGAKRGDVTYLLNGPAIKEFSADYAMSAEDEEDLDE